MTVKTADTAARRSGVRERDPECGAGVNRRAGAAAGRSQHACVLLVEDKESFSDALSYLLRKQGFEVALCPTGTYALEIFDRTGADLVLIGLMPPGAEACRKGLRQRSNVPVIMLTAKDTGVGRVAARELGADEYVTVPFSWRELLARIRAVLSSRSDGAPGHVSPAASQLPAAVRERADRQGGSAIGSAPMAGTRRPAGPQASPGRSGRSSPP